MGMPTSQARIFQANIADELMILDVDKLTRDFASLLDVVSKVNDLIFMPLSVGGGIRTFEEAARLFEIGVEKVVLDSIFASNPNEVERIAIRFGSQSVIGSCTFWGDESTAISFDSKRFLHLTDVPNRIKQMEESGVGEVMINDASKDGLRQGSNLRILKEVVSMTSLPVIDSCGFGKTRHFIDSFRQGASAVAVGSYFAYVDQSILQLRNQISNYDIKVRIK
jgi:cyclase